LVFFSYLFFILCNEGKDRKAKNSPIAEQQDNSLKTSISSQGLSNIPGSPSQTDRLTVITVDGDSDSDDFTSEFDDISINENDRFM